MKKYTVLLVCTLLVLSVFNIGHVHAEDLQPIKDDDVAVEVNSNGYTTIGGVKSIDVSGSDVILSLEDGHMTKISFLDENLFRYYVNIKDKEFLEYPAPRAKNHEATIVERSDKEVIAENNVKPKVTDGDIIEIKTKNITVLIEKKTSKLSVKNAQGKTVMKEVAPIMFKNGETVQSLSEGTDEYFFGGGTQNGRFSHKGHVIKAARDNNWVDGGVASPNPYYWSTNGYGILRNTFYEGEYDFGSSQPGVVQTKHSENRFDAYVFVADTPTKLLNSYTNLTGKPAELPDYGFYLSHLNCYNRDAWIESPNGNKIIDGKKYTETNRGGQVNPGEVLESLLTKGNNHPFTAQRQIELHDEHDLPLGWILPNDGYGCGYGQTDTLDGDIEELKQFVDFANAHGVEVGLWTQSNLWPKDPSNPQKGERDIRKEVEKAGVRAVKTDVAWVGAGYSMALDGVMKAYDAITELGNSKPAIVSLNGWGGTQRYAGIWSGDQSGGNWEYIRFHIPTYIGTGLSGMPYVGSDMDGIFGGKNPVIQTRDFQWKAFTPYMLDMDGWGSSQKNPWEFGEPNTSINRAYLKLKAEMMPYIATASKFSSETGVPMVRAMLFEEMNSYTLGKETQYQFMWGDDVLVAPMYKNTQMDKDGNDVRNNIYLPGTSDVWIDYLTGEQYRGGRVLNDFDAPVWKTPVFVRNGAIIPLYAENNNPRPVSADNPKGLDKSIRRAEVFPFGNSEFEVYEDDGITFKGQGMRSLYTSSVEGDKATITFGIPKGTYNGVETLRSHEVIMNVSEAPTSVKGMVGGNEVEFTAVTTMEEYENAQGNVYFYDESPLGIVSKYATEGSNYDKNPITRRPQVFIKSTDKVNIFDNEFKVTVEGFKNDGDLNLDELNTDLEVPQNLKSTEVTDSEITLTWDKVSAAETYDVEVDGTIVSNFKSNTFTDEDLNYSTDYKYRVRSVSKDGYSEWSEELVVTTAEDPYRNVPKGMTATWTGNGSYTGKPADAIDLDFATQFHSKNDAIGSEFIIDMKLVHELDKFEYVPRQDNFGNGTLRQFELEYSIDGIHWKTAASVGPSNEWTWPSAGGDDLVTKTLDLDGISARYLKIIPKKSVGNFFTAFELIPYAKEGKPVYPSGDTNFDGELTENDLVQFENYMGLKLGDADFGTAEDIGHAGRQDFNFNGVIDVYDVHYTAHQLNGGAKKSGPVEGKLQVIPDKTSAKKGDVVTYTIYGMGMKNVNAFGLIFNLDRDIHVVNTQTASQLTAISSHMRDFSQRRIHTDDSATFSIAATNVGENEKLNGTEPLATLKLEYKEDVADTTLDVVLASLVGSDLSIVDGIFDGSPNLPDPEKVLTLSDIKSLTFSNDKLPEDKVLENGYSENGKALFQQGNYAELLFDGDRTTEAEFKWFMNDQSFGPEVKLPTDFVIELKEGQPVTHINVVNRPSSTNGRVKSMSAKAYIGNEVIDLGTLDERDVFTFEIPKNLEARSISLIDKVVITPLSSRGTTSFPDGNNANRMLTLQEIEIVTDASTPVEEIEIAMKDEVYLDSFTKIDVNVLPNNASNPLVNVVSDNPEIATVQKIVTETSYDYYLITHKPGKVTLTANSLDNESITATKEITVLNSIDKTRLEEAIADAEKLAKNLYTEESYTEFETVLKESKEVLVQAETATEITNQAVKLRDAMKKLEFKGSDDSREDSKNLIDSDLLNVVSATNHADNDKPENVIDKDENTIWHSSYQSSGKLPVDIVVDLNGIYALEQIDMLPRQNSRNGHITHYRIETSLDGKTFTPLVSGFFEHDGNRLLNPDKAKQIKFAPTDARYVKFVALETLGDTPNKYASIAELSFYGIVDTTVYADSITFAEESINILTGAEHTLETTITPNNYNEVLNWASEDESIATVENGVIKGVSVGTTTIKVTGKHTSATLEVTVTPVGFDDLKALIKEAEGKVDTLHTFVGKQLKESITIAKTVEETTPEAEIKDAYNTLKKALEKAMTDNAVLEQFEDYRGYDLSVYDKDSTSTFKAVLKKADTLVENGINSIEEVTTLNKEFKNAITKLVKLDRAPLETLVDILGSIDVTNTTQASKTQFNKALENAKAILKDGRTNAELENAYNELRESFDNLVFTASEDVIKALEVIADTLNKLDLKNYTDASQKAIVALQKDISEALAKDELLAEEASELLDHAKEVISSLKEKEDNNKPGPGGDGDDDNKPGPKEDGDDDLPGTGIGSNPIGYILLALGTVVVFFKRKKQHN